MNRLRRWYVPGGFVLLTALALGALPEQRRSSASDKADAKPVDQTWVVDRSLTLTPRPETVPALRYRLFPLASELKEGNAVPIYLRLVHERNDETRRYWQEKPAAWNKLPLNQLPVGEVRKFFDGGSDPTRSLEYMMKQLELGARRRTAEWNYTLDAGDPIGILLPDAQMMRLYGPMLVLKARMEIAEGKYAAAAHTLQTGFAFSHHVIEGPFLINGLVGIAIASQLTDVLLDWVSQPDAPNLYWSLTALPPIDLRKEYEFERRMVELQFPVLADLKRERAPAEWDAALKQVRIELERILSFDRDKRAPLAGRTPADPAAQSPELPAARKYLVERLQFPAARVEAMPPAQVILLHMSAMNDELQDDTYKGVYLPTAQALPVLQAAFQRLKSIPYTEATRIPFYMVAAVHKIVVAQDRLERKISALRTIEALRLYAAAHGGQLPEKLGDITEVPVPIDPGTGRPFEYRRENDTATLTAPPLDVAVRPTGQRYRLTIKNKP